MDYKINHIKKTIRPTASKAEGLYEHGLLAGRHQRGPPMADKIAFCINSKTLSIQLRIKKSTSYA